MKKTKPGLTFLTNIKEIPIKEAHSDSCSGQSHDEVAKEIKNEIQSKLQH